MRSYTSHKPIFHGDTETAGRIERVPSGLSLGALGFLLQFPKINSLQTASRVPRDSNRRKSHELYENRLPDQAHSFAKCEFKSLES